MFVLLALAAGFFLFPSLQEPVWALLHFGSAAAVVVGVHRRRPNVRLPWYLLAAGIAFFGLGDLVLVGLDSSFQVLADASWLSTYLLFTVALLKLVRVRSHGRDMAALLDALVVTTGLALLSWQFLMLPYVRDTSLSLGEKLYSLVFPLADVMVLAVLLRLWTGGGGRGWAYYLLGIGCVAMLASDTASGLSLLINGDYQPGGPIDIGYLIFPPAFAAAALHPSMPGISLPGRRTRTRVTRGRLALLVGAVVLAQAVIVVEWVRDQPIEYPVVAGAGILMSVLTFVRFGGMARDIAVQHERRRAAIQIVQAGDQERKKVAADLHDGPVQQIAMLSYTAHLARKQLAGGNLGRADEMLDELERELEAQVRELRQVMSALRPPVLDQRGLEAALEHHVKEFETEYGIAADLAIERPADDLASEAETVLYRIAQEALSNVRKHARANHAWVTIDGTDDGQVRLRVRDNGVGFDPAHAGRLLSEGHFGLAGMRERVTFVGGREVARVLAEHPMADAVVDEVDGRRIRVGSQWLFDFASCNYLGLDLDPEIQAGIPAYLARWGTHPSWARAIASPELYPRVEAAVSRLLGVEDVLAFPSLTHTHNGVLPALAGEGTLLVDLRAHQTLHDAAVIARARGATVRRFRSGDLEQVGRLLRGSTPPRIVCMDGVNSMTGNPPDLQAFATLVREHDATLYVDDAHGFGVIGERSGYDPSPYGRRGNGVVRWFGDSYDHIVLAAGFSKAYSSLLAFVAVPSELKQYLKVMVPTYVYGGPVPVAALATTLLGLAVNERRGDELRAQLYHRTRAVLDHLDKLGVATSNVSGFPLIELALANPEDLHPVGRHLFDRGVYVTLAPYPVVPRDEVGFRIQLTAANTADQVDHLLTVLGEVDDRFGFRRLHP